MDDIRPIVVVADEFIEESGGGAALTTEALLNVSPYSMVKIRTHELTLDDIVKYSKSIWVFANYFHLNFNLIEKIIGSLTYAVIEYDMKYCIYRSPATHISERMVPCECGTATRGLLISSFLSTASVVFWMSRNQMDKFLSHCPPVNETKHVVLSSAFSIETLDYLNELRLRNQNKKSETWMVIGSPVWMKGRVQGKSIALLEDFLFQTVWDKPYEELLKILAGSRGLVFLPQDGDTCPRLVIEAKLLGCELVLNDNVQHKDEFWFDTDDLLSIEDYLLRIPFRFWNVIQEVSDHRRYSF